jgi:hypothetical protein
VKKGNRSARHSHQPELVEEREERLLKKIVTGDKHFENIVEMQVLNFENIVF